MKKLLLLFASLLNIFLFSLAPAQKTVFRFTGAVQTYQVPPGVTYLYVKSWGAGGGISGGSGAFIRGILPVTPGETLSIIVGQGGTGEYSYGNRQFGGGGTCRGWHDVLAGGGGGLSGIERGSSYVVIAAGGGGGSQITLGDWDSRSGGYGGVLSGGSTTGPATGGTQTAGGNSNGGFLSGADYSGAAGSGGGGGLYGGGTGSYNLNYLVIDPAGGGSSWFGTLVGPVGEQGQNGAPASVTPGGAGDSDYVSGVGIGQGYYYTDPVGNGMVVVQPMGNVPTLSTFTVTPNPVLGGTTATGTITLSDPAPPEGWTVNLTSQYPNFVSVPTSVTVPEGATSVDFAVTTNPYRQTFVDVITASDLNSKKTVSLTLLGDSSASLSFSPSSVYGGQGSTGKITLSNPAPVGGWNVSLTSQSPTYVQVPASVVVPAGAMSATFPVTTRPYSTTYINQVTASDGVSHVTGSLTILGDSIVGLSFNPNPVFGGSPSTGTVTLLVPAPDQGWVVTLQSQSPGFVSVPASVTVPAGATSATFPITTKPYTSTFSNVITATDAWGYKAASLTVLSDIMASFTITPNPVVGGNTATGTITLSTSAPAGGWNVNLKSTYPNYVSVPTSVTIPEGSSSIQFTVNTKAYRQTLIDQVLATDISGQMSVNLTLLGGSLASVTFNPSTVVGGAASTGTVTLNNPAPVGGWTVSLTSQSPNYVQVPASVVVPEGASSVTFTATTHPYRATYANQVMATDATSQVSGTLTLLGDSILSLTFKDNPVTGGSTTVGTVTLSSPAPSGGWVVNLGSQSPNFVSVPASITIPAGATSGTFTVTTKVYPATFQNVVSASDLWGYVNATLTVNH